MHTLTIGKAQGLVGNSRLENLQSLGPSPCRVPGMAQLLLPQGSTFSAVYCCKTRQACGA